MHLTNIVKIEISKRNCAKRKKTTKATKIMLTGLISMLTFGTVALAGTTKVLQVGDNINYHYYPISGDTSDNYIDGTATIHGYKKSSNKQIEVKVNAMYDSDGNPKENWKKTHWQINNYYKGGCEHLSKITTVKKSASFKTITLNRKVKTSEAISIQAEGNSSASGQITGSIKDTNYWYVSGL